jgi:O-acetyl-ADP-ribose deacetylase (regulator of RNase III)
MPLEIVYRRDITKIECDAIVNAANSSLLGGGGVDGAIHTAAGPGLLEECRTLGGCETGDAKITKAYDLPCKFVIHAVGPIWGGGGHGEEELLRSCYRRSLELAEENGCESVAFPLISAGVFGYPKSEAFAVAVDEIGRYLRTSDMNVIVTVFFHSNELARTRLYDALRARLYSEPASYGAAPAMASVPAPKPARRLTIRGSRQNKPETALAVMSEERDDASLEERLKTIDESFSQMLLRKIDELGMTDAECYRRANIDRRLFSKIRSDVNYKPSKATALAFAIALKLPLKEAREFLMKAGFAFSPSSKFDVIVEYFIENGVYDIFEINQALYVFDQPLLGA